jgi:hypothetical protein
LRLIPCGDAPASESFSEIGDVRIEVGSHGAPAFHHGARVLRCLDVLHRRNVEEPDLRSPKRIYDPIGKATPKNGQVGFDHFDKHRARHALLLGERNRGDRRDFASHALEPLHLARAPRFRVVRQAVVVTPVPESRGLHRAGAQVLLPILLGQSGQLLRRRLRRDLPDERGDPTDEE